MSTTSEAARGCEAILDGIAARWDRPPPAGRITRRELSSLMRQGLVSFRPPEPKKEYAPRKARK